MKKSKIFCPFDIVPYESKVIFSESIYHFKVLEIIFMFVEHSRKVKIIPLVSKEWNEIICCERLWKECCCLSFNRENVHMFFNLLKPHNKIQDYQIYQKLVFDLEKFPKEFVIDPDSNSNEESKKYYTSTRNKEGLQEIQYKNTKSQKIEDKEKNDTKEEKPEEDLEFLGYRENLRSNHPVELTKFNVLPLIYFECEIISSNTTSTTSIGLVVKDYPVNTQIGWNYGSVGYHGDDGGVFFGFGFPIEHYDLFTNGDVVGCGLLRIKEIDYMFFTKNGKIVFSSECNQNEYTDIIASRINHTLYFSTCMWKKNSKSKYNFGSKEFMYKFENLESILECEEYHQRNVFNYASLENTYEIITPDEQEILDIIDGVNGRIFDDDYDVNVPRGD